MIAPIFDDNTVFIKNSSLEDYNVDRELKIINPSMFFHLFEMEEDELLDLSSPRILKNGETVYLSNGVVSWMNCQNFDFEELSLPFDDEIEYLVSKGLKFRDDMVIIDSNTEMNYLLFYDRDNKPITCDWVHLLDMKILISKYSKRSLVLTEYKPSFNFFSLGFSN